MNVSPSTIPAHLSGNLRTRMKNEGAASNFGPKNDVSPPNLSASFLSSRQSHIDFQAMLIENEINLSQSAGNDSKSGPHHNQDLSLALSKGVVNPIDWVAKSDIELFQKTTGKSIKDGNIVDQDGSISTSQECAEFLGAIYEMRNFGTFDHDGQPRSIDKIITANDIGDYINHHQKQMSINQLEMLRKSMSHILVGQV